MSAALLLAAGSSRRFGSDKRLHPLPDGRPILLSSVETYLAVFDTVWVVTKPAETELEQLLAHTAVQLLQAPNAELGMGHSLAEAVHCIRCCYSGPLVVGLADMPYVTAETLRLCKDQLNAISTTDARIVQPRYQRRPGNPVGFSASFVDRLINCRGDQGARQLIKAAAAAEQVSYIDVEDPGVLQDIDTPDALAVHTRD